MRYEMKEINPEVKNCNILKKKKKIFYTAGVVELLN